MDRKFKLAVIARVERHPEIWNFTSEDYKKQDVRLTAWDQIVAELQAEGFDTNRHAAKTTWKRLKDTFSKRLKHYPPGAAKAWVYDEELQFLMASTSSVTHNTVTGPDEEESTEDVKGERFDKEGSVTTEDGFTDTSSASVASPSSTAYVRRQTSLRRGLAGKKEHLRADRDIKRNSSSVNPERLENNPDRFDILGQYIAQTLRELSPEVSSVKILEITKVLHTSTSSAPNSRMNTPRTPQHNRR
uniref:MADF domain-containing protein n=1 Tax=Haemonchus contortus TaxID=6289 RepID=A0A7I4XR83_HAECO